MSTYNDSEQYSKLYSKNVFNAENNELTITGEALLMNKKQYVW